MFGLKGNTESIHPVQLNATFGRDKVLKCNYLFDIGKKNIVVYWKKNDKVICYIGLNNESDCQGLQHTVTDGQVTLTIPNLSVSNSGQYTCSLFTQDKSFECNFNLVVQAEMKRSADSNGINLNQGSMYLLLLLTVIISGFPFISL
ncbi:hypothetical protein scyTo_0014832 [Scyliorhinus torazame]|uniref:Ig-like domain-containing protein n=1 Tax=Scyliorhinus torazame TaxID=75743 RepID=A0A401NVN8_SCYTO|nr:hypothetical protein [Scyliorhinus torazame]